MERGPCLLPSFQVDKMGFFSRFVINTFIKTRRQKTVLLTFYNFQDREGASEERNKAEKIPRKGGL